MATPKAKDLKHLEGSFPVDGKETPVTHEAIEEVNADQWPLLPTQILQQQYVILNKRLIAAQSVPNVEIIKQIQRGLVQLKYIIDERDEDTKLI